ncbi:MULTISPECIES: TolC family protein [Tenacibaculum]|uniref:TolC family protein n=1 Tax=Tenacibaculum TaxID=104267 RepID=UPI001F0AF674|nr:MULTISPECIES: TolC family protein [Tenacibaculum]MCH3881638.1 TolC family protein [Tenacibaculum aquimarinum]MDO6598777.1 TolC family protein [Tenacibaculum sp. 1_MG-2023]
MKRVLYMFIMLLFVSLTQAQETEMSLSLKEAINYAITNSYQSKTAKNDIRAAEKRKWETTTIGLPQIDAKIDYINNIKQQFPGVDFDQDGTVDFGAKQSITGTATLRQLLFDGSYLVGLQSAKTYLKISNQAKEKKELVTREAVINAYGNILVAEKSIEILERNKKVNARLLKGARAGYENGLAEQEDVEQFEVTEGSIISSIRNANRMKDLAYQMLNLTLGIEIETKVVLKDSLEDLVLKNTDLNLITTEFNLNNHIDYKIAENSRESNRLLMKLEKSKALPSLNAFINYSYLANSDSFTFFNSSQNWIPTSVFGVSLNVPIFSSGARNARTAQATIALENSDIELEEIKQRLNLQAKQARSNYQLSIENYETAKKNLGLAERIENKNQIKFKEGVATSFELFQAQQQLYAQQNNFVQSMLNIIANKATLENALNLPIK